MSLGKTPTGSLFQMMVMTSFPRIKDGRPLVKIDRVTRQILVQQEDSILVGNGDFMENLHFHFFKGEECL